MSLHTYNQENGKKDTVKSIKTLEIDEEDAGVTNEEEARIIIKALKNVEKILSGEIKTQPINKDGWLDELIKWADSERKKENGESG